MIINWGGDITHQWFLMPRSNDSDLGRRVFVVQKEKAVENALDKIRRRIGADWCSISPADCDVLKETLGEIWTSIERPRWSTYRFSKLTLADIYSLVAAGKEIREKHYMTDAMLLSLDQILIRSQ
ncbi:hypothetical protein [Methanoregula sp.]|uniref:hypothetical protein n=1 Tax=Methanoregula sp. TaxID=2052170 RepID=UPI003BAE305F